MDAFKKGLEQAQQAAAQAAAQASAQARATSGKVNEKLSDPATSAQARVQMAKAGVEARRVAGKAKRGITTVVEKIDPGLLADVVIKATALQEKANASLRQKRSPYRIAEVVISAAIPPQVSFSIARVGDAGEEEITGDVRDSAELIELGATAEGEVLALDGSGPSVDLDDEEPQEAE